MCPLIETDFSEAVDKLPTGEYAVRVVGSEVKTGKTSNEPYISWTLETFGRDNDSLNGRKIWHTTPVRGKGAGILRSFLTAVGVEVKDQFDTTDIHGNELIVSIAEDDQGFMKVKSTKRYNASNAA